MIKNFIILGQAIVIGILALTLIFSVYSYHRTKEERDDWTNFMIQAYSECEYECENCLNNIGYEWKFYCVTLSRREIDYK
jgi:hypothetical protein